MKVTLLDCMGDDLAVVNAARVSFDKESDWLTETEFGISLIHEGQLTERDDKLIHYLATHGHWSPFTHAVVKLRVKAPIFVARQLVKHQVGLSWNEVSRRYVDTPPEFYEPPVWRKRAENVKQGSSDEEVDWPDTVLEEWAQTYIHQAASLYEELLKAGVAPEQARMVLPLSTYTEWVWTGSLCAWARVYNQRIDAHSQRETQEIARQIGEIMQPLFPVSWAALTGGEK